MYAAVRRGVLHQTPNTAPELPSRGGVRSLKCVCLHHAALGVVHVGGAQWHAQSVSSSSTNTSSASSGVAAVHTTALRVWEAVFGAVRHHAQLLATRPLRDLHLLAAQKRTKIEN